MNNIYHYQVHTIGQDSLAKSQPTSSRNSSAGIISQQLDPEALET